MFLIILKMHFIGKEPDLLYEVEDTYTVDVDLVRSVVRFEAGDLESIETWNLLQILNLIC